MIYSPRKKLYGNFTMGEVAKSPIAERLEIDNTPSDDVLDRAEQVAIHILQPVRDHFGIPFSPNSWFRCEELEREITRKSFPEWCLQPARYNHKGYDINTEYDEAWAEYFSRKSHPKGEGVDFEIPGIDNHVLYKWCTGNLPEYDQLISEFMKPDDPTAGWVHGSYCIDGNRMQQVTY